jgi:hypothetical protein
MPRRLKQLSYLYHQLVHRKRSNPFNSSLDDLLGGPFVRGTKVSFGIHWRLGKPVLHFDLQNEVRIMYGHITEMEEL